MTTMKVILELEVDDLTGAEYEQLGPDKQLRFKNTVGKLLQKTTASLRAKKLRKLLHDMCNESSGIEIDPETLYAIVRQEEY